MSQSSTKRYIANLKESNERLMFRIALLEKGIREVLRGLECQCDDAWLSRGRHETHCTWADWEMLMDVLGESYEYRKGKPGES